MGGVETNSSSFHSSQLKALSIGQSTVSWTGIRRELEKQQAGPQAYYVRLLASAFPFNKLVHSFNHVAFTLLDVIEIVQRPAIGTIFAHYWHKHKCVGWVDGWL